MKQKHVQKHGQKYYDCRHRRLAKLRCSFDLTAMNKIIWDYPDDKQRDEAGACGPLPAASVVKPPNFLFSIAYFPEITACSLKTFFAETIAFLTAFFASP
jgi:hypothetical protein